MMRLYSVLVFVLILGGFIAPVDARIHNTLKFTGYDYEEGLAINPVEIILQDHQGYMWFASRYGLSRFDGYTFITYTQNSTDTLTLSDTHVNALAEDSSGTLWIATHSGLDKLSPTRDHIESIPLFTPDQQPLGGVFSMHLHNNTLWLGCDSWLVRFDRTTHEHLAYPVEKKTGYPSPIYAMTMDPQGDIWFSMQVSLHRFNPDTAEMKALLIKPPSSGKMETPANRLISSTVNTLMTDPAGTLWIGTWGGGLSRFNHDTDTFYTYPFSYDFEPHIINKAIRSIAADDEGVLWLATETGLYRFNPTTGDIRSDQHSPLSPNSLSSSMTTAVYRDRSGGIWVATDTKLHRYEQSKTPFQFLVHNPDDENSLGANAVYSIAETPDGTLWFGTHLGGLNRYSPDTGQFTRYTHDPNDPHSIPDNTITALASTPDGKLWVGTWTQGITLFDPTTGAFRRFPHVDTNWADPAGNTLSGGTVRAIEVLNTGEVWIGTESGDINIYDPATDTFRYYIYPIPLGEHFNADFPSVYSMKQTSDGSVWIGTGSYGNAHPGLGLYRYDLPTREFQHYQIRGDETGLWGAEIPSIYEDHKQNLWIATDNGLSCIPYNATNIIDYYPSDGIWGNVIESVVESNDGLIWVATKDFGLSVLNPETDEVINFGLSDGLLSLNYLSNVALKARDGTLYFGGTEGVTVVPQGTIPVNTYVPPVRIEQCRVRDVPVVLDTRAETRSLQLAHTENSIQFDFVALNYTDAHDNQYQYRLLGLDDEWTQASARRNASFSYLPPGDYTFQVKASNNDGIWNPVPTSLAFTIAWPFWQMWWFRSAILLTAVALIVSFFYWRVHAIRSRNRELETQVKARTLTLKSERDYLQDILTKTPTIIFGFTPEGVVTFINPSGEESLNLQQSALGDEHWWNLFPLEADRQHMKEIHKQTLVQDVSNYETNVTLGDSGKRSLLFSFVPHANETGVVFEIVAFANDVTEKVEREILEASSREQRNIGREIHDSICQTLTGIYCLNETLSRNQKDPDSPDAQLIERMKKHVQDVTVQSRTIARSLYLHELEHNGLDNALAALAEKMENLFRVPCSYQSEGPSPQLDFHTATHVYRIAQEALNNAVKYSSANEIRLRLHSSGERITMVVQDQGKGFDPGGVSSSGMGMSIMKYRARMIKADLSIDSQPGSGTTIRCALG